ncbi:hypothetical protein [Pandoraea pnomenusa]|uniref:hypothetical protein n=1 Tax=Pandoraea pnomenusa TaxID=93220 RepID=UPI00333F329E
MLALHGLAWLTLPVTLPDLRGTSAQRPAMQAMILPPPVQASPAVPTTSALTPHRDTTTRGRPSPTPATRTTRSAAAPAQSDTSVTRAPPALQPPTLDWRADVAREAGALPGSKASPPAASAERAITDQSHRAPPSAIAPAPGDATRRAFEREFGTGHAAVSGPNATREGENAMGTTECIEMNGKRTCSRQRNRASDIDPFMKRERVFSPIMR